MKTISRIKTVAAGFALISLSGLSAQAKGPDQQKLLTALFSQSEKITVVHNSGAKTSFAKFMSEVLLTTHFTLTPGIDCEPPEGSKTLCTLTFSAESQKNNSTQTPDPDEAVSTYLLNFTYSVDSSGAIKIDQNRISYRIDQ